MPTNARSELKVVSAPQVGRLHVLTDEALQERFSHVELARLAAEGGADIVQYRDKAGLGFDERVRVARDITKVVRPFGTDVVVNDRIDVARACGAQGVHLGSGDPDPREARALLGDGVWIGVTANDVERAVQAAAGPANYLGVGPVFGTRSKRDPAPALGLDGLRRIVECVGTPVVAIGGIKCDNVRAVLETGAHGVAVLSTVVRASDPGRAVRELVRIIDACRRTRGGRAEP
jgi:thiamine-phosphate pyrophosphorylase